MSFLHMVGFLHPFNWGFFRLTTISYSLFGNQPIVEGLWMAKGFDCFKRDFGCGYCCGLGVCGAECMCWNHFWKINERLSSGVFCVNDLSGNKIEYMLGFGEWK
jgi:hypothetical protein